MYKMVYFFGPDGTGKTTQAKLVSSWLKEKGFRVWRTSVKHHHMLSYLVLKLLYSRGPKKEVISHHGFDDALARRIRTPWKFLELASLLLVIFYRVILFMLLGYVVVCDRYVLDTLVVLSYFLKNPKLMAGTSVKLVTKLIPRNSLLLYLDAETDVILWRKKDEPLTTRLIEYYRRAYKILVKQLERMGLTIVQIDTTSTSIEDVYKLVLSHLDSSEVKPSCQTYLGSC